VWRHRRRVRVRARSSRPLGMLIRICGLRSTGCARCEPMISRNGRTGASCLCRALTRFSAVAAIGVSRWIASITSASLRLSRLGGSRRASIVSILLLPRLSGPRLWMASCRPICCTDSRSGVSTSRPRAGPGRGGRFTASGHTSNGKRGTAPTNSVWCSTRRRRRISLSIRCGVYIPAPLILGEGSLADALDRLAASGRRGLEAVGLEDLAMPPSDPSRLLGETQPLVALVLYLCAENTEIGDGIRLP
jgi:hypothetical protein